MMVHFEAEKLGLSSIPKEALPDLKKVILRKGHLLIPLIVMVLVMVVGYSPITAVIYSIITALFLSFVLKDTRMSAQAFLDALKDAARTALPVAMACACAGVIIGSVYLSGTSYRFTSAIIDLSGNILIIALILTMFTCILLGMGMTTTAVYITMAALVIPALVKMGVPTIGAHLFAFYFGVISAITPPVALAAYAASGLAGAPPGKTGFTAWRLGIVAFIVPFMFVYGPELTLIGYPLSTILIVSVSSVIGIICLSGSMQGWFMWHVNIFQRIALAIAALILIKPGIYTDILGLAIITIVIAMQKFVFFSTSRSKLPDKAKTESVDFDIQSNYSKIDGPRQSLFEKGSNKVTFIWIPFIKEWFKLSIIFISFIILGLKNMIVVNYNFFLIAVICLTIVSVIMIRRHDF